MYQNLILLVMVDFSPQCNKDKCWATSDKRIKNFGNVPSHRSTQSFKVINARRESDKTLTIFSINKISDWIWCFENSLSNHVFSVFELKKYFVKSIYNTRQKGLLRSPFSISDISPENWSISEKFLFVNGVFWNFTGAHLILDLTYMQSLSKIGGQVSVI